MGLCSILIIRLTKMKAPLWGYTCCVTPPSALTEGKKCESYVIVTLCFHKHLIERVYYVAIIVWPSRHRWHSWIINVSFSQNLVKAESHSRASCPMLSSSKQDEMVRVNMCFLFDTLLCIHHHMAAECTWKTRASQKHFTELNFFKRQVWGFVILQSLCLTS